MVQWIKKLPAADKDAYLTRFLAEEGDLLLRAEMSKRFREATLPKGLRSIPDTKRRTVGQLLAARNALVEEKNRQKSEQAARERARLDRERAKSRTKQLDNLARRESAAWTEVEVLIASKKPKDYDLAVSLLVDLRDLAKRSGRLAETEARIREIRQQHGNKPSLIKRFDDKNLGK
jgi:hypothetical protein